MPFGQRRIDGQPYVAHRGQLLHPDHSGFFVDSDFHPGAANLPKWRKHGQIPSLPQISAPDDVAVGYPEVLVQHLAPGQALPLEADPAGLFHHLLRFSPENLRCHPEQLSNGLAARLQDRSPHHGGSAAGARGTLKRSNRGVRAH